MTSPCVTRRARRRWPSQRPCLEAATNLAAASCMNESTRSTNENVSYLPTCLLPDNHDIPCHHAPVPPLLTAELLCGYDTTTSVRLHAASRSLPPWGHSEELLWRPARASLRFCGRRFDLIAFSLALRRDINPVVNESCTRGSRLNAESSLRVTGQASG